VTSLFDPSAFIEAEQRTLATLAEPCAPCDTAADLRKPAENSEFSPTPNETFATIAGIAAPLSPETIWTDGPALLAALPRPVRMASAAWRDLVRATKWIADDWARDAAQAGWHPLEFFGCNPDPFAGRLDRDGLIVTVMKLAAPAKVTAIHADGAVITCRGGATMTKRLFGPRGQVFLWEAYAMKGGP